MAGTLSFYEINQMQYFDDAGEKKRIYLSLNITKGMGEYVICGLEELKTSDHR
jgi:hypothetical protein